MIRANHRSVRFGERYFHSRICLRSLSSSNIETNSIPPDVLPPLKRYRSPTSVLNALASCVKPVPEAPDFRLGGDPWLGSTVRLQSYLLARAKGRLAARMAARDFFPNDIVGVAKEFPRIDRLLPLQTPDSILDGVTNGSLSKTEAMDRLILLIAPRQAWKLYSISEDEKWSEQALHRLLDLLCATNGGDNNFLFSHLNGCDWSNLPDPDETYFTEELESRFRAKAKKFSTRPASTSPEEPHISLDSDGKNTDTDNQITSPEELSITSPAEGEESIESTPIMDTWSSHNSAEQLFLKESQILRTPAAYRSMIRGASKFGNPNRALELAESAWSSPDAESSLDLPTYNILLRSLHKLYSAGDGTTDLWTLIVRILEKMRVAKLPVHITTFNQILYTLSEAALIHKKYIVSNLSINVKHDYVPQGLGLMQEIRRLGLKPTLGTMNNLLRLIASTVVDDRRDSSSIFIPVYSSTQILTSFITELEERFNQESISRFDPWTADDYSFFPTAMNIAWIERDFKLGLRIHNLLMGEHDRRFLLPTSMAYRKYAYTCSMLMFSRMETGRENPLDVVKRYDTIYKFYRDSILTTEKLVSRLINAHSYLLHTNLPEKSTASLDQARSLSYTSLCRVMEDLLGRNYSMELYLSGSSITLVNLLVKFAHLNPTLASQISAQLLTILRQVDEKTVNDAAKAARTNTANSKPIQIRSSRCQLDLIPSFICLVFPALNPLSAHGVSAMCKRIALDTLQGWFDYALSHDVISWSWAPRGLAILLQQDVTLSKDFTWTVLEHLNRPGNDLANLDSQIVANDLLDPILDLMQADLINRTDTTSLKKVELLNTFRQKLSSSSGISDSRDTSSSSSESSSDSEQDN